MDVLSNLANELSAKFLSFAKKHFNASMFVKLGLVLGGATIAAVCQGVELAHANHEFSSWSIAGFAGAVLVAIGGVFVAMTETDIATTLDVARRAIDEARLRERRMERFNADRAVLRKELDRGLELYNSMDVMRGSIEQSLDIPDVAAAKIIQTCLAAARNSLLVALDFSIEETWTICVYMAEASGESDKINLRCIAHARKIECEIEEARLWQEGVGVAGVCYSMGNEIIIPDMAAPELGTVFHLAANNRPYDIERYRSMASIPICIGSSKTPWGVVVVTTDLPGHFTIEPADGVSTSEPVRAIAAMAALAVRAAAGPARR
ncbi:hypothetical protein GGQ85_000183 [Nitrobacter vulgaris]|uniref:hypothetical protein n=1 Tax=Nitrobacter vulgaris TaxID=29421 RepID=UPI002856FCD4|nr:hypothetical protein [Nitrobacter vulgaris]MDR6302512.1 hypothetical protein [Nitrobacter vulgaris]